MCKLQAAETTVSSLTKQVTELSSSDTLSRIRDNYNQALNTAAHEHKEQLLDIQQEADHYRQQLEDKACCIHLCTLLSLYVYMHSVGNTDFPTQATAWKPTHPTTVS